MILSNERKIRLVELLATVRHLALATVNDDGMPHNSPVFAAFDADGHFVWSSHAASLHSQNIARTGKVFITIFDSHGKGGGIYVAAAATQVQPTEINSALAIYNAKLKKLGRPTMTAGQFVDIAPQQLYMATAEQLWCNQSERDDDGFIVRDHRLPLTVEEFSDIVNAGVPYES